MLKTDQIPVINNLRGIASLSVCLFHFIYSTVNYVKDEAVLNVAYYGQFGVALFFVISGIVIPLSLLRSNYTLLKWPKFFIKRIIRIEPPYLVALTLAAIIVLTRKIVLKDITSSISLNQIVLHVGYLIPFFKSYHWLNEVFWTLAIEFQYYLIISILIVLVIKGKFIGRMVFYSLFLLMPFYFTNGSFFPPYAALFLMGTSLSIYYVNKATLIEFMILLGTSTVVAYLKVGHIETVIGFFTVITVLFLKNRSIKILNFFGNISYSLYLIHPLIGASVINILSHHFFQSWQKPIVISFGLAITLLCSCLMYRFVEKPTQLLSKRIIY